MKSVLPRILSASMAAAALSLQLGAQGQPPAARRDPRVGLKAGLRDAGEAAMHLERVSSLPKPEGFFDPKAPAGEPTEAERETRTPAAEAAADADAAAAQDKAGVQREQQRSTGLSYANSDLAFKGEQLFIGNFHGFNTYDIEDPRKVRLIASVVCPGGQGDVSVHGNLLIMSVEQTRARIDCGTQGVQEPVSAERFRGIRVFDITDVRQPRQVAAVQTCRGSHTHTLVSNPKDPAHLYVYGSGTSSVRSAEELEGCSAKGPEDPNTSLFSIDVIQIPLVAPEQARVISRPRIFSDLRTGALSGLWPGGDHGPGTQRSSITNRCHDITVYPEVGLAAGACSGNGILLDISDPANPVRLDQVVDKNFAYWHSATFNNDGTKVVFTDEWGGGTRPRCRASDPPTWGANAIFEIVEGKKLRFGAYYKLPAHQTEQENCVAHNGSIIPVPGRDIMVQGWYQGGVSVFDFTDAANPREIAYFDRGPVDAKNLITGGYWSTYWYNGFIYGAEIARGLDVFRLLPSEHLSRNEIEAAQQVRLPEFNPQQQLRIHWKPTSAVARAYVDQLQRSKVLQSERLRAVNALIERMDRGRPPSAPAVDEVSKEVQSVAAQLLQDASTARGRDAERLKALAATLKGAV